MKYSFKILLSVCWLFSGLQSNDIFAQNIAISTAGKFTLKIQTNTECSIIIDGDNKGTVRAGEVMPVLLGMGTFKIMAKPISKAFNVFNTTYEVTKENINKENQISLELTPAKGSGEADESESWFMKKINNIIEKRKLTW